MRYKVKNIAALDIALAGLPDQTQVNAEPGIGVSAKTVGELRKPTAWPESLAITISQGRHSIQASKPSVATRIVPKT